MDIAVLKTELKNCPFCGADYRQLKLESSMESVDGATHPSQDFDGYRVMCKVCHTNGPRHTDEMDALHLWNQRPK